MLSLALACVHPRAIAKDLTEMTLEELLQIDVTTVARKEQKLSKTASAVYVVTSEDIRRSGATSIAESLRMAPGLQVARVDNDTWMVTARGFASLFANKLLVLIDGRSVYTPLFSGVYWDSQDTLLEDIDRIEVIRGPGATIWGANAVNGVINIITKSARDTHGGHVTSGSGNNERGFGSIRYGGGLGPQADYRVYSKYFNRSPFVDSPAGDGENWESLQGGFRLDWQVSEKDHLKLQGDSFGGHFGTRIFLTGPEPPFRHTVNDETEPAGSNALARWEHVYSDRSDIAVQFYFDRYEREQPNLFRKRDTFDVDFQHRYGLSRDHELLWGVAYRLNRDRVNGTFATSWDPASREDQLASSFVQDEITLLGGKLVLTAGSKFEHNDYSGFEVQPSARIAWTPGNRHTGWAAVSRAVRTPSRTDHDARILTTVFPTERGPTAIGLFGSEEFESEDLTAYELGYRIQPRPRLSFDVAAFYNVYKNLATFERGAPVRDPEFPQLLIIPRFRENRMDGETYGAEVAATWGPSGRWKLRGGYSWLRIALHREASSRDVTAEEAEGLSPEHQFHIRSYLDLPWKIEWDTALYYVDDLPASQVPSYVRLDTRLGWRVNNAIDLSLSLQNLLENRHVEFFENQAGLLEPVQVERGYYGKITWRF